MLAIFMLCLPTLISERFRFFPPPAIGSWQYHLFWVLFRIFVVGLVAVSLFDFNGLAEGNLWLRYLVGLPLLTIGFSVAIYLSYFFLGKTNAYGGEDGLRISGCYRWSRNPIYVVSIIGMAGWGLFVNSLFACVLLALWALLYIVAPFIEEPWLEYNYGSEFIKYKSQVPRFIGWPKSGT